MDKKAKLTRVQTKKSQTDVSRSSTSSACRKSFLSVRSSVTEVGSCVHASATRRRPTTKREEKITIEVYGEEKRMLEFFNGETSSLKS